MRVGNGIEGIVRNVEEAVCLFRRPGIRLCLSLMRTGSQLKQSGWGETRLGRGSRHG